MHAGIWLLVAALYGPVTFERHDIDAFPAGYQVAVADLNADGRPDVIALSTDADCVDWYENPAWQRRPIARTAKNIDLAVQDVDGDRRPEIALATGFYFNEPTRGGEIVLLRSTTAPDDAWTQHLIATDPVVHRVRWGDCDADGRRELIHAPLFGRGSAGTRDPEPAHLWSLTIPAQFPAGEASIATIDETLTVLHGIYVTDLDRDGRDELLTASFEGLCRFDLEGEAAAAHWRKQLISPGADPATGQPGAARGSSEVAVGNLGRGAYWLAAIEPWHGNQVVVYSPQDGGWQRRVLDDRLTEGHALVVADFDRDGVDEVVAGWRGAGGGLMQYTSTGVPGEFRSHSLDHDIAVEGLVAADMNSDGRLDLVAIAGRTNNLVWYENTSPSRAFAAATNCRREFFRKPKGRPAVDRFGGVGDPRRAPRARLARSSRRRV